MTSWMDKKFDGSAILQAVTIIVTVIILGSFMRKDIDLVVDKQSEFVRFKDDEVPKTYVRKDVITPQLESLKHQLDRIEQKLDDK